MKDNLKFYSEVLEGEECACGKEKKRGFAFCYRCYQALPEGMKRGLWKQMCGGFEEAYEAAYRDLAEQGKFEEVTLWR